MDPYPRGYRDGIRAAITWLHKEARAMNDPHARASLNGAAFSLGNHLRDEVARKGLPKLPDDPEGL